MSVYRLSGVDVEAGDSFSKIAGKICRSTFNNSPFIEIRDFSDGFFRGPRGFRLKNLPDGCFFDIPPDGVGTAVVLFAESGTELLAARNLVGMTNGDMTRYGGLPLVFVNILDTSKIGSPESELFKRHISLLTGLGEILNDQRMVLLRGETAELGPCVGSENPESSFKFNWSGATFGVYHEDRMITGNTLAPGQIVVALREYGFGSNGLSAARKGLRLRYGAGWWNNLEAADDVKAACHPVTLYDRFLCHMNGWGEIKPRIRGRIHLVAHITGGGIKSKFAEDAILKRGLSAHLNDLWQPPQIMLKCAEWTGMSDEEFYSTWNGGQRALVVVDEDDAGEFLRAAYDFGLEAKMAGKIIQKHEPTVIVESKLTGKTIEYKTAA